MPMYTTPAIFIILGPLLFVIYISDLSSSIMNSNLSSLLMTQSAIKLSAIFRTLRVYNSMQIHYFSGALKTK